MRKLTKRAEILERKNISIINKRKQDARNKKKTIWYVNSLNSLPKTETTKLVCCYHCLWPQSCVDFMKETFFFLSEKGKLKIKGWVPS